MKVRIHLLSRRMIFKNSINKMIKIRRVIFLQEVILGIFNRRELKKIEYYLYIFLF